jgi:cytochrome c biogenesis protein CcmG, thiol:disulfide interchange protein DsbE
MASCHTVRIRLFSTVLLLVGVLLSGCGSTTHSNAPGTQQLKQDLKGSPPKLAALHAQANDVLGGGTTAFKARLASLRGYPVVVNKWASWCPPCRTEFPMFQQVAAKFGRRVAFIGINGHADTVPAATAFLKAFPLTYPSYEDPNEAIARTIEAATYDPMTVFFDRHGHIVFAKAGEYASVADLERDVRRYALG